MRQGYSRKIIALAAISWAALPGAAAAVAQTHSSKADTPAVTVPPFAYKVRKLKNGLTVYTLHDPTTPNVVVSRWYDVGSKHDPENLSGFAHLFEHLLSRKTVNMPYAEINRIVEEAGGSRNAFTNYDYTIYLELVPAASLETMLWTHAERMARSVIDQHVLDTERAAIRQELSERILNNPYGPLGRFGYMIIPNYSFPEAAPHRKSGYGVNDEIANATVPLAVAFEEAYYGPDTASMIIAGNFDEAQLNRWVDKYLGNIPARKTPASLKVTFPETRSKGPRLHYAFDPALPAPAIASSWRSPPAGHPDTPALEIISAVLTQGDSSRLRQSLVQEKGLLTQLYPDFRQTEETGYLALWGILAGGKKVEDAEAALASEIERIRNFPISAAELREAKNELLVGTLQARETLQNRALEFGRTITRMKDPSATDKMLAAMQKLSVADVQRVARKYLGPDNHVSIRYLNEKGRANIGAAAAGPPPLPRGRPLAPSAAKPREVAPEEAREAPPAPGPTIEVQPPVLRESRLQTGLQIITAKTSDLPLSTLALVIKGGASSDPTGRSGLAALVADVARRGTKSRTGQQIASEIESLGATLSTTVEADGTILAITAPTANLEAAGLVLADIARNAVLSKDEVERSRTQAVNNFTVSTRNPVTLANLALQRAAYGSGPYGNVVTGTAGSLQSINMTDVSEFYRRWWHPANSAIVIAGGIDVRAAAQLAQRLFGEWTGVGPAPGAPAQIAGKPLSPRTIVIDMPEARQAGVVAAVPGTARADPDFHSLNIANLVLGVGVTSRLFQEIRLKRGLSYGPTSSLSTRRGEGLLIASAPTPSDKVPEALGVILTELDRLGKEALTEQQVEARRRMSAYVQRAMTETSAGFVAAVGGLIQQGLDPSEILEHSKRVAAADMDSVNKAAQRLISADKATVVVVGDASKFIDKLRALRGNVEVIKLNELSLDSPELKATVARNSAQQN